MKSNLYFQRRTAAALVSALLLAALVACKDRPTDSADAQAPAASAETLTVLATTDLKDALPLEEMVEKATGVRLKFSFGGTSS